MEFKSVGGYASLEGALSTLGSDPFFAGLILSRGSPVIRPPSAPKVLTRLSLSSSTVEFDTPSRRLFDSLKRPNSFTDARDRTVLGRDSSDVLSKFDLLPAGLF